MVPPLGNEIVTHGSDGIGAGGCDTAAIATLGDIKSKEHDKAIIFKLDHPYTGRLVELILHRISDRRVKRMGDRLMIKLS